RTAVRNDARPCPKRVRTRSTARRRTTKGWKARRSGFADLAAELVARMLRCRNDDLTVHALVTHDILLQRHQQALGMFRREDDAALDLRFGNGRHDSREIDDELRSGMRDDGEIRVVALRDRLVQFEIDT